MPAGFTLAEPRCDHAPPGATLPPDELAKRLYKYPVRPANVHVRQASRFNQRYALLCRDYLRAHPGAAAAYCEIKQALAARFSDDCNAYYAVKDPVFDLIMAGAEDWARSTSWRIPPGD